MLPLILSIRYQSEDLDKFCVIMEMLNDWPQLYPVENAMVTVGKSTEKKILLLLVKSLCYHHHGTVS